MSEQSEALNYSSYLHLDELLGAQHRRSDEHDEEEVQRVLLGVYGDDGEEAQVCERLVDLDEGFQEWRYRHVNMVERTIGDKVGTGGSPGAAYLRTTLFTPVFPDLWAIRSAM